MGACTGSHVRQVFDRSAAGYDRQVAWFDRRLIPGGREWVARQARGRVVEIGVGTGLTLPLYPAEVSVIGYDLSEAMLAVARRRATGAGVACRVDLRLGDAARLPLPDGSVDTVVSTYTWCTLPDPDAVAGEAHRVLAPGGRFVLAEHGPARNVVLRALMRLVEPITVRTSADYLTRDPRPTLERAGFTIDEVTRTAAGIGFRILAHRP